RREINAASVSVGFIGVEAVRARADDATVNDDGFEIETIRGLDGVSPQRAEAIFKMFQHLNLFALERGFEAVGESHEEMFFIAGRRASDDAHGGARVDEGMVGA